MIVALNKFWSNSPDEDAPFSEHLDYFLKNATAAVHNIHNDTGLWKAEKLNEYLFNKEEGYCVGNCGIILVRYCDDFQLKRDILEVHEI